MFAREKGAVAAPTAALHFTPELMTALDHAGIGHATLTLHVGAGTFLPVKAEDTDAHVMHSEWGRIGPDLAERLKIGRAIANRVEVSADAKEGLAAFKEKRTPNWVGE